MNVFQLSFRMEKGGRRLLKKAYRHEQGERDSGIEERGLGGQSFLAVT